jgi:hypothetical protein
MGRAGASGFESVGVGGVGDGGEVELAGEPGTGERGFEGGEIEII